MGVARRELHHQRRKVLGEEMFIGRRPPPAAPWRRRSTLAAASAAGRQSWPATSTWMSPPIAAAAATAFSVAALERRVVMLGDDEERHQITLASFLSLSTSSCDRAHLACRLALRRLLDLERDEARRHVDAQRVGRQLIDRLLLRLHDVGQRGIARLVEAQIGGHHRRQLELDRLEAAIDLARHQRLAALDLELRGEGALRPAEQCRQHLPGLVAVVVDRLLAEDDRAAAASFSTMAFSSLATASGCSSASVEHMDAAIGAHGQRGADRLLAGLRSRSRPRSISVATPASLSRTASSTAISSKGFIDILTLAVSTPGLVRLHPHLDVVVDDALDGDENFHGEPSAHNRSAAVRRGIVHVHNAKASLYVTAR